MAKLFLIIICVCTACVHLAWAQMARKDLGQPHKWIDVMQTHRQQGQPDASESAAHVASDLEYGNQVNPIQSSNFNRNDLDAIVENKIVYDNDKVYRNKRHAGHSHHDNTENLVTMNPNTDAFIEKLFKEFTNGDRDTMNLIQFENMMKTLKLDRFIEDNQLQRQSTHSTERSHDESNYHAHSNETVSNTL